MHIINTLQAGGAELQLLTLCRSQKAEGLTPFVTYLKNCADDSRRLRRDFENEGIRVFELNADARLDWSYLPKCLKLLKEEHPDLVHTHLPRADIAGATIGMLGSNVPWISSIHAIYSESWSGRWALPVFDFAWRRADQIVAISQAVKDWLIQERGQLGEKIRVVHYGIEAGPFLSATSDLRERMGLGACPIIGSIGRLEAGKGHDVLIRAMPAVLREFRDAVLLIAGHDTWGYRRALQELIDELHLEKAVRLMGFQADIPGFLKALDVFAFASHSEGFGQVVVEAMAAARPIVVRGKAPLTEIVTNKVSGLLASGDAPDEWGRLLLECVSNPAEAKRMGLRAQRTVRERFSVEKMTVEILALYDRVLRDR